MKKTRKRLKEENKIKVKKVAELELDIYRKEKELNALMDRVKELELLEEKLRLQLKDKMSKRNLKKEVILYLQHVKKDEKHLLSLMDERSIPTSEFVGKMMTVQKAICIAKLKLGSLS